MHNSLRTFTIIISFLFFQNAQAHPGIGIVKDNKGNIFYTDLRQVWKIANGKHSVIIPNVHTHELYIDKDDNLYGENERFVDEATNRFDHYLWRLSPSGSFDTLSGPKQSYISVDFSLARDRDGNEFYTKNFLKSPELGTIYKRSPAGKETLFARTQEKRISWLHPQADGSLLYVMNNNIYRVVENGSPVVVVTGIASDKPRYWNEGQVVYGVWGDENNNVYAAVFSDQSIKKISPDGKVSEIYRSEKNWAPAHGLFDHNGELWVIEYSKDNETRVIGPKKNGSAGGATSTNSLLPILITGIILLAFLSYVVFRSRKTARLVNAY